MLCFLLKEKMNLYKTGILLQAATLFSLAAVCWAEHQEKPSLEKWMPVNPLAGFNDKLQDNGMQLCLSYTNIYQQNVRGGISTHRHSGRFSGSYELQLSADLEKLLGVQSSRFFMMTEGSFSNGINSPAVGSFFGINADAAGDRPVDIHELWYQQLFANDTIRFRIGKLDLAGSFECHEYPVGFDGSAYANNENIQFLNASLVNNPVIPFPQKGLGAALFYVPGSSWYIGAAVTDAQADVRETGLKTTFHGKDYFFYIFETGITPRLSSANGPLQGTYRAGLWYDPQPKANTDYGNLGKTYRDDVGFYLSCDQMLTKENDDPNDTQGLGAFFRFGYANSKTNDISNFWSFGFQYQGLLEDRNNDVLGVGFARGFFSDRASATYTDDYESVLEIYYSAEITPSLIISPGIQFIANPGGRTQMSDAIIIGCRLLIIF